MFSRAAAALIRGYQLTLGPLLGGQCRFAPSCSEYARQVFLSEPPLRAFALSVRRLLRCHPFHPGGLDLPPATTGQPAQREKP